MACGLLDALVMGGSVGGGVELCHMDGDRIVGGELANKSLVAVAVGRTEVEVAMGDGKGIACRVHEVGKYHRIDAPTNGKQHLLPCREEVLLPNVSYECL